MAWRGRGRRLWSGRGPFSYLPPWQMAGWWIGLGFRGWNPWVCARYPWLPRWWWAYPYSLRYPFTPYPPAW